MENKKLRAGLYIRVSKEEQLLGYGIDVQDERGRAFIQSQNYFLDKKHTYREEGYSGTLPISERPELKRLFEDAKAGELDIIIVPRLDRFFRKTRLLLDAVEKLNSYGAEFRSASEAFDTSNATGRIMLQSLAAIAELERETIKERMQGGLLKAAEAGKWVIGTPPYGYRREKDSKKPIMHPQEAKWVKTFFEWLTYERCALREIARRANAQKVPTPEITQKKNKYNIWWPRTLGRILANETYTGIAYINKFKKALRDWKGLLDPSRLKPEEGWIAVPVPPIISRELFDAAQKQLKRNSDLASRNAKRMYLFSKLLYCGTCGFRLRGGFSKPTTENSSGSVYYRGYLERKIPGHSKRCQYCGSIAESRLMPMWEVLKEILTNPKSFHENIQLCMRKKAPHLKTDERIKEIESELKMLERKRQKISFAFLEVQDIDEREYKKRLSENKVLREKLQAETIRLAQVRFSEKESVEQTATIEKLYRQLKKRLQNPSYKTMFEILHLLVGRIDLFLNQNYAEVLFEFPGTNSAALNPSFFARQTPLALSRKTTPFAGQSPKALSRKTFTINVKIPLISLKEWREISSGLHVNDGSYTQKEARAMSKLAERKAQGIFV